MCGTERVKYGILQTFFTFFRKCLHIFMSIPRQFFFSTQNTTVPDGEKNQRLDINITCEVWEELFLHNPQPFTSTRTNCLVYLYRQDGWLQQGGKNLDKCQVLFQISFNALLPF